MNRPELTTPITKPREEAFDAMFSHMLAMASLYARSAKHIAPEEAKAGERVKAYLERNREAMRAEVMKP